MVRLFFANITINIILYIWNSSLFLANSTDILNSHHIRATNHCSIMTQKKQQKATKSKQIQN